MPLPNAYIIGVQKAGTTSFHDWLSQHPDIYAPIEFKDLDYFADPKIADSAKSRLLNDYSGYNGESVILQSQVNYILYSEALDRIKSLTPEAKVIIILRDPVKRAISAYGYFKKIGREERPIEEALLYEPKEVIRYSEYDSDFTYLEHGMYGRQLETVFEKFEKDQILILEFEELKKEPNQLVKKTFNFLGVSSSFTPVFKKKNQTGTIRFKWLQNKLTNTNVVRHLIVKYLVDWWLPAEKRRIIIKKIMEMNTKEEKEREADEELIVHLEEVFKEDQKKLYQLLNSVQKKKRS